MTAAFLHNIWQRLGPHATIPTVLNLRNVYLLPTGYGLLYLILLGGMLTGSINYNNNLGFLLTFLLGSVGVMGLIHTSRMLVGLRLETAEAAPVFAGEALNVEITVSAGIRSRIGINWYFDAKERITADFTQGLRARVKIPLTAHRRGVIEPGRFWIVCTYPLGLFRVWAKVDSNLTCLVYPRPLAGAIGHADSAAAFGEGEPGAKSGADDFQGLTAYQAGDPPRRIHWPAYSRGRGLQIKHFTQPTGAALMLSIEDFNGMDTERKLSILCYWVLKAHRERRSFGLNLVERTIPVGKGRAHRERCLRALALYGKH